MVQGRRQGDRLQLVAVQKRAAAQIGNAVWQGQVGELAAPKGIGTNVLQSLRQGYSGEQTAVEGIHADALHTYRHINGGGAAGRKKQNRINLSNT